MTKQITIGKKYYVNLNLLDLIHEFQFEDNEVVIEFADTITDVMYSQNGTTWNTYSSTSMTQSSIQIRYDYGLDEFKIGRYNSLDDTYTNVVMITSNTLYLYGLLKTAIQERLYNYLLDYFTYAPEQFILYNFSGRKNIVNKSARLSNNKYFFGSFKEEIDILNPEILIESDTFPSLNYAYIKSLNRYYFIESIICVRNTLYRLSLKVDVLYSYQADIKLQKTFVSRCQRYTNVDMEDDRLPLKSVKNIDYYEPVETTTGSLKNATFSSNPSGYSILLNALTSKFLWIYNNIPSPDTTIIPNVVNKHVAYDNVHLINKSVLSQIVSANVKDNPTSTYIKSILLLPIDDCRQLLGYAEDATPDTIIAVGTKYLSGTGYDDNNYTENISFKNYYGGLPPVIIADFTCPRPHTAVTDFFLNYEPYSTWEMYIPFVGIVKLNPQDIIGNQVSGDRIIVYYSIDENNGGATCYVYNVSKKRVVFSTTCQVGIQIPIDTSNYLEIQRQKTNSVSNAVLGLIASTAAFGIGAYTGSFKMMAAGAAGAARTLNTLMTTNNLLFDKANVTIGSPENSLYGEVTKVWLKVTTSSPLQSETGLTNNDYREVNGYPYNQYNVLSSFNNYGYVECPRLIYRVYNQKQILPSEISEIELLARDGIIL